MVLSAHGGRPFIEGRARVALKMANEDEIMAMIIKLQLKLTLRRANLAIRTRVLIFCEVVSQELRLFCVKTLTRSRFWSFSVDFSFFSSISSSRNVGLRGFMSPLPGVPGTFMALFNGDLGVMGMDTDSRWPPPI